MNDDPTMLQDPASQAPEPSEPRGSWWLFYLFLRPKTFFAHFVEHESRLLAMVAAWLLGVGSGIHALDGVLGPSGSLDELPSKAIGESWGAYWRYCAGAGVVTGSLSFLVGAWWYRQRLSFSGAPTPDAKLARRVYLFASLVVALPSILYTVWRTQRFENPIDAAHQDPWDNVVLGVFLLWSVVTSYVGVQQCFRVRYAAARVWFLVLPMSIYGLALFFAVTLAQVPAAEREQSPAVSRPVGFETETFVLRHPGNWRSETFDGGVTVRSLVGTAEISIHVLPSTVDIDRHIEVVLAGLANNVDMRARVTADEWGAWDGRGYRYRSVGGEYPRRCHVFVANGPRRAFIVQEEVVDFVAGSMKPGFALVRESFALK